MEPQQDWPSGCTDKFLVQTCTVPKDTPQSSADVIIASCAPTDIRATKLHVVLLGLPQPPMPSQGHGGHSSALSHVQSVKRLQSGAAARFPVHM